MTHTQGADCAERRTHNESILARYPEIQNNELEDLQRWFRREATAFEVGIIASDPSIAEPYRRFSAEHLEPMTFADFLKGTAFVLVLAGFVCIIVMLSL